MMHLSLRPMSVSPQFLELLVHPVFKTALQLDASASQLTDPVHNDYFPIKKGVPVLRTENLDASLSHTQHHQQTGTEFHYKQHYQADAAAYDYTEEPEIPIEKEEVRRLRQNILSEIPTNAAWILDVGCGGAWLAKTLAPKGRNVISMDISDINPIKALQETSLKNHHALVADVFELPLKENSIDCIVASEIIEHVTDPKKFLAALFQVLKPGGKLIITTIYNEYIRTTLCIHCNRLTPLSGHLHSFTEKSLKKYLPPNTRSVKTKVFNSKVLVKTHLQKMISFLPLKVYAPIDKAATLLTGKRAFRFMIEIEK